MSLTNKDLQAIQTLLLPIHGRLDKMDDRLDKLDSEVSSLKTGQLEIKKELKEVNRKVSDTYLLALDAWGTGIENRTWIKKIDPSESAVIINDVFE